MSNKIHPTAVIDESVKLGNNIIVGAFTVINARCVIGNHCIIGPFNCLEAGVIMGDNCTIQPHCVISIDTIIEDNVFIGPHYSCSNDPHISDGFHGTHPMKKGYDAQPITIKKNAMLGTRVTIAPNVTIGEHARIDMCCFITKNVEPYAHMRSNKMITGSVFEKINKQIQEHLSSNDHL